jgi:hypothetical protein
LVGALSLLALYALLALRLFVSSDIAHIVRHHRSPRERRAVERRADGRGGQQ